MIVGSGLLAKSFTPWFAERDDVCIYAAGVSNSACVDSKEFERERLRLLQSLEIAKNTDAFVYFGTCSVDDSYAYNTAYVQHKLAMEKLVAKHPKHLIIRLPQIAGKTPNPHTLLNYLFFKISTGKSFYLWNKAKRNIIDVDDISFIVQNVIDDPLKRNMIVNIANPVNYSIMEIVNAIEVVIGKNAVYVSKNKGSEYIIDIDLIRPLLNQAEVKFDNNYLNRIIAKYYGRREIY
ncbi:MAG: hypothetical protein R8K21_07600 [Mariprofundales bacterium]